MFFMKKMPAHPPKFPPGFCAICTPPGQNIALPQFCAGHGAGDGSLFWWDLPAGPGGAQGQRAALPENAPCAGCGRSLEQETLLFFSCPCYTSRTGGGDSLRPVQKNLRFGCNHPGGPDVYKMRGPAGPGTQPPGSTQGQPLVPRPSSARPVPRPAPFFAGGVCPDLLQQTTKGV